MAHTVGNLVGAILALSLTLTAAPAWAQAAPQLQPPPGPAAATTLSGLSQSERDALTETDAEVTSPDASKPPVDSPAPYNPLDTYSFYLTALFIAFGLGVILLQLAAMRRIATVTADEIARNCAITLVVVASVALLVSGYSSQQVAPAFGLFGTIIGYLLGKAGAKEDQRGSP